MTQKSNTLPFGFGVSANMEFFAAKGPECRELALKYLELEAAARHWVESTDDSCQCGYFEECVTKDNPEGWGVCGPCAVSRALEAK